MRKFLIAAVLFALPAAMLHAQATLKVDINGATYTDVSTAIEDQFPSATNGQSVTWVDGAAVTNYNHGVYVVDMDGADLHAKLVAATALARTHSVPIILPGGVHNLDETWKWSVDDGPLTQADLFTNIMIIGNGCHMIWTGSTDQAMWEMPSPNYVTVTGPLTLDGKGISGVIGMWLRPAWEYNRNGMRNVHVQNVRFDELSAAVWLGDSMGPDFRPNTFDNCFVDSCVDGFVFQGSNVTSTGITHCSINCDRWAIRIVDNYTDALGANYNGHFDSNKITDPWQTVVYTPDMWDNVDYPTGPSAWNLRIVDSLGNKRGTAGYIANNGDAEALIIGGSPTISVRDCDGKGTTASAIFAKVHRGPIVMSNIRYEGLGPIYECTEDWHPPWSETRFVTSIENCTSSNSGVAINNQGGPKVIVRGGRYSGTFATHASSETLQEGYVYVDGVLYMDGVAQ